MLLIDALVTLSHTNATKADYHVHVGECHERSVDSKHDNQLTSNRNEIKQKHTDGLSLDNRHGDASARGGNIVVLQIPCARDLCDPV